MDAVISIGGQSFLDGIVRLLGPSLLALRTPLPIALPGLSNGLLTVRNIQPVVPSSKLGAIELLVEFAIAGEVLIVASVAAENVNLSLGTGDIDLDPSKGGVKQPKRTGTLATKDGTGTVGGLALALDALGGTLELDELAAAAELNLDPIVGKLQFAPGVSTLALPLPAVVPMAIDFTPDLPLSATVVLDVTVNGSKPDVAGVDVEADREFGLEFVCTPTVNVQMLSAPFAQALHDALATAVARVVDQLLAGLTPAVRTDIEENQPERDLPAVANNLATAILTRVQSTLKRTLSGLVARTGRLVYPPAAAGASCDRAALPTAAKVRLISVASGSQGLALQVGFNRVDIPETDTFPAFSPTALLDTSVTISNEFLLDLLCCLLQKLPNLSLPSGAPSLPTPPPLCCRWDGVALNLGVLTLKGTLDLCIEDDAGEKKVTLSFDLTQTIANVPAVAYDILFANLRFKLTVAFDLSSIASITALRLSAPPANLQFDLRPGGGLIAALNFAIAGMGLLPGLGALIQWGPPLIIEMSRQFLLNTVDQVLTPARLLESPAAIPPGIFDAFGTLVPASLTIDDLNLSGVLDTPTSPWSLLPIVHRLHFVPRRLEPWPHELEPSTIGTGTFTVPMPSGGTTTSTTSPSEVDGLGEAS